MKIPELFKNRNFLIGLGTGLIVSAVIGIAVASKRRTVTPYELALAYERLYG